VNERTKENGGFGRRFFVGVQAATRAPALHLLRITEVRYSFAITTAVERLRVT
jgi:hypothetical protein